MTSRVRLALAVATMTVALGGCSGSSTDVAAGAPSTGVTASPLGHVAGRVGMPCTSGGGTGNASRRATAAPVRYVLAYSGTHLVATGHVDQDGNYYLTLPPGTYALHQDANTGVVTVAAGALSLESFVCGTAQSGVG